MNIHPMGDPGETLTDFWDQRIAELRHITAEQVAASRHGPGGLPEGRHV
jgi:hypothetical protein